MNYDYLIVGAGLYSAVFAHEMTKQGKHCLVIDRREHLGGNIYTEQVADIHVHKYGAHIFHTSDKNIWDYVNKFATFRPFINAPIGKYKGKTYNLPFNMNTFAQMWGISTPEEAKNIIAEQVKSSGITEPKNLEEKALSFVGRDIYQTLIKGYTEKQWGKSCCDLPAFIINRIPLRFTYDNNYFNDLYQGIPVGGYTQIVEKMLQGCDVQLSTDYKLFIKENPTIAKNTLYTGSVDELLDYKFGELEYRSLTFEEQILNTDNFQGNAVVNYTEKEIPYTRVIEHKFFDWVDSDKTVVSYEYPSPWSRGKEAYYPINNQENMEKYQKYSSLLKENHPHILLGGRLGLYSYLDMDKIILKSLTLCEEISDREGIS